jgi:hypothetical protein
MQLAALHLPVLCTVEVVRIQGGLICMVLHNAMGWKGRALMDHKPHQALTALHVAMHKYKTGR